jgi:CHASE2 domain-containing sensor protein
MAVKQTVKTITTRVVSKGVQHWMGVAAALLLGLWVGHLLRGQEWWQAIRFATYRAVDNVDPDDRVHASRTVTVMIGDAEYDSPELQRRTPLNREYLARLVDAVAAHKPHVIAIDVDLTAPLGGDHFSKETNELRLAVKRAAEKTQVVLATTVTGGPQVYQRTKGLLDDLERTANVSFGCVTLAEDRSQLGMTVPIAGQRPLDAFATAIARIVDPKMVRRREQMVREHRLSMTFLPADGVPRLPAAQVRANAPGIGKQLHHAIVIIGGDWHVSPDRVGRLTDQHRTPVGLLSGAVLNANYVEALLAPGGTKKPASAGFNTTTEVLVTLALALIFAVVHRPLLLVLATLLLALSIVALSLFMWQNLGGFFDCSVPIVFLAAHATLEKYGERAERPRKLLNVRFAVAVAVCIVSLIGLIAHGHDPILSSDHAAVAQVAALHITATPSRLEPYRFPVQPAMVVNGRDVNIAKNEVPAFSWKTITPRRPQHEAAPVRIAALPETERLVYSFTGRRFRFGEAAHMNTYRKLVEQRLALTMEDSDYARWTLEDLVYPRSAGIHLAAHGLVNRNCVSEGDEHYSVALMNFNQANKGVMYFGNVGDQRVLSDAFPSWISVDDMPGAHIECLDSAGVNNLLADWMYFDFGAASKYRGFSFRSTREDRDSIMRILSGVQTGMATKK